MKAQLVTVGTTPTLIAEGGVATVPKSVVLRNDSGATVYLGASDVNTTAGFPLLDGESTTIFLVGETLYGIAGSSTVINVLKVN